MNPDPPEPSTCPTCGADLATDGACLWCLFQEAAEVSSEDGDASTRVMSWERVKAAFTGLELPCEMAGHRLVREVAAGGMGVVYEAEDLNLKRTVAMKMIRAGLLASPDELNRFRAEARTAALLDHPHIVPIYEVGEVSGMAFFTMRLVEGGSLAQRLREQRAPMEPRAAARLMATICRAVQFAHERGVLHRDLKPGNILLEDTGNPQLTDFGLAKLENDDSDLTGSQAQVGTPHYMSPEQAAGKPKEVTTASDVWALGVILYQLLTHRLPFRGEHRTDILHAVIHDHPSPPSGVDRDLSTLCLRCLEKEPAKRLSSAGLLADELERWLRGEPIHSRPVTWRERLWKSCRRHPALASLIAACTLLAVFGGLGITLQWRRALQAESATLEVLYFSRVTNAISALHDGNLSEARNLVDQLDKEQPAEGRGLEWFMIKDLCKGDDLLRAGEQPLASYAEQLPAALGWTNTQSLVAVGTLTGLIDFWDPGTQQKVRTLICPVIDREFTPPTSGTRLRLLFSPDDRFVIWNTGNIFRLLNATTGELYMDEELIKPSFGWLDATHFYLSRRRESDDDTDPAIWIVEAPSGKREALATQGVAPMAMSTDHEIRAETLPERQLLLHVGGVEETLKLPGEAQWVELSADNRWLAVAVFDNTESSHLVLLYSISTALSTREPVQRWLRQAPTTGLAFHPTLPWLAWASDDTTWSWQRLPDNVDALPAGKEAGKPIQRLGHDHALRSLALQPQGAYTATLGLDHSVRLWKGPTTPRANEAPLLVDSVRHRKPMFGPSEDYLLSSRSGSTGSTRLFRYGQPGWRTIRSLEGQSVIAWQKDSTLLAWSAAKREIVCWRVTTEGEATRLWSHPITGLEDEMHSVSGSAITADGSLCIMALNHHLVTIELPSRQVRIIEVNRSPGRTGHTGLSISANGRYAALFGYGTGCRLFTLPELDSTVELLSSGQTDTSAVFSPDSASLMTGNEDGTCRLWNVVAVLFAASNSRPALPFQAFPAHQGPVTGTAISPDGHTFVTSGDKQLKLWDTTLTGFRLRASFPLASSRHWLRFSPDGHWLHHAGVGDTMQRIACGP